MWQVLWDNPLGYHIHILYTCAIMVHFHQRRQIRITNPIITLYYAQLFPLVQIWIRIPVRIVSRMVTVPILGTDLRPWIRIRLRWWKWAIALHPTLLRKRKGNLTHTGQDDEILIFWIYLGLCSTHAERNVWDQELQSRQSIMWLELQKRVRLRSHVLSMSLFLWAAPLIFLTDTFDGKNGCTIHFACQSDRPY